MRLGGAGVRLRVGGGGSRGVGGVGESERKEHRGLKHVLENEAIFLIRTPHHITHMTPLQREGSGSM